MGKASRKKREDGNLLRMLKSPPKPHAAMKAKKPAAQTPKTGR
jgi:hypothetical protein